MWEKVKVGFYEAIHVYHLDRRENWTPIFTYIHVTRMILGLLLGIAIGFCVGWIVFA